MTKSSSDPDKKSSSTSSNEPSLLRNCRKFQTPVKEEDLTNAVFASRFELKSEEDVKLLDYNSR